MTTDELKLSIEEARRGIMNFHDEVVAVKLKLVRSGNKLDDLPLIVRMNDILLVNQEMCLRDFYEILLDGAQPNDGDLRVLARRVNVLLDEVYSLMNDVVFLLPMSLDCDRLKAYLLNFRIINRTFVAKRGAKKE